MRNFIVTVAARTLTGSHHQETVGLQQEAHPSLKDCVEALESAHCDISAGAEYQEFDNVFDHSSASIVFLKELSAQDYNQFFENKPKDTEVSDAN